MWKQGHGGETEADAFAIHIVTARHAGEFVSRCGVAIGPFTAAAVVVVHGTIALGGGAVRARGANNRVLRAVLSNLARLAAEGVCRVVAHSTDRALATAQERLVRAGRALKAPGPVSLAYRFAWPIGSL